MRSFGKRDRIVAFWLFASLGTEQDGYQVCTTMDLIYLHIAEEHFASQSATFVPLKDLVIRLQEFRHLLK